MLKKIILIGLFSLSIAGCKDREDPPTPAQIASQNLVETITTLKLYFTDRSDTTQVSIFSFKDPDASGAQPYTILDTIKLAPNKTYDTRVILLNEMKTPVDSVSNEIYQERSSHQLFYRVTGDASSRLQVAYKTSDIDSNAVPVGLRPVFSTTSVSNLNTGKVKVKLMHQPGVKPALGQGDSTLGKIDIQVVFPILIQ